MIFCGPNLYDDSTEPPTVGLRVMGAEGGKSQQTGFLPAQINSQDHENPDVASQRGQAEERKKGNIIMYIYT